MTPFLRHLVIFYMPANLRHGTDGFTSTPKEVLLMIFCPKNSTASVGFEPANLGNRGQNANHKTAEAVCGEIALEKALDLS
jgi:hypothetical protein